jgi:hypothetical protein
MTRGGPLHGVGFAGVLAAIQPNARKRRAALPDLPPEHATTYWNWGGSQQVAIANYSQ